MAKLETPCLPLAVQRLKQVERFGVSVADFETPCLPLVAQRPRQVECFGASVTDFEKKQEVERLTVEPKRKVGLVLTSLQGSPCEKQECVEGLCSQSEKFHTIRTQARCVTFSERHIRFRFEGRVSE